MARFDDDIAGALEAIREDGEMATLRRVRPGAPDPSEPSASVPAVVTETPIPAVFLNYRSGTRYADGTYTKVGDKKILVPGAVAASIDTSDQVIRADGTTYKIEDAILLDPNGQKILWTLRGAI